MYRHILIPTDGSELAEHGVTHGLALAKSLGAKVSLIFVMEPFSEMTGRFLEAVARYAELRKEQAASVLDRAANAAKEAGVACETIQVENGQPHQAIIAAAEDKGCDLIVMSSHGRSGLSALLIDSVTMQERADDQTPRRKSRRRQFIPQDVTPEAALRSIPAPSHSVVASHT